MEKKLSRRQKLIAHMKTHLTCSICKTVVETNLAMLTHKKEHSTCNQCKTDFKTAFRLKKYMSDTVTDL